MLSKPLLYNDINQQGANLIGYYIQHDSNEKISKYLLILILVETALLWYYNRVSGILIMILAFFPTLIIIYTLRKYIYNEIGTKSFSDLFIIGSTISVITTILLEGTLSYIIKSSANIQKNNIFKNEHTDKYDNIYIYCDCLSNNYFINKYGCICGFIYCFAITIVRYIISVGLIEESSKLIGLLTLKYGVTETNIRNNFLSHVISSNYGYVLSGISCSLGFATIENIGYLTNCENDIGTIIIVGIARSILSVPFHVSASGFSCILLSNLKFSKHYYNNNKIILSILKFLSVLPTSVLHGIYDTCLMLLMEFNSSEMNFADEMDTLLKYKKMIIYNFFERVLSINNNKMNNNIVTQNSFTNLCFNNNNTLFLTITFMLLAITSYIICLYLFIYYWINLKRKIYDNRPVNSNTTSIELFSSNFVGM